MLRAQEEDRHLRAGHRRRRDSSCREPQPAVTELRTSFSTNVEGLRLRDIGEIREPALRQDPSNLPSSGSVTTTSLSPGRARES